MKIGLIDVDSHNFPNLALMKLSFWHKISRDSVNFYDCRTEYDIVYKSKIFTFTPDIPDEIIRADKIIKGGYGYDPMAKLPDYIDAMCPDYSLYPEYDFALGYISRGCVRKCGFCAVHRIEGKLRQVATHHAFWQGQKEIVLMDNNFTALPNRMNHLESLARTKSVINFKQGLDIRLIDDEFVKALSKCRLPKELHFAFDDNNISDQVAKGIELLRNHLGKRDLIFYVLCGYNTTIEQDVERLRILKKFDRVTPFVMIYRDPYDKVSHEPIYKHLARWANRRELFKSIDFYDYQPVERELNQMQFEL